MTALATVASTGHAGMVRFLVSLGANPDAVSEADLTPLQLAVSAGHGEVVKALVEAGADVQRRGKVWLYMWLWLWLTTQPSSL
jgi:ankyrin repeat protein